MLPADLSVQDKFLKAASSVGAQDTDLARRIYAAIADHGPIMARLLEGAAASEMMGYAGTVERVLREAGY